SSRLFGRYPFAEHSLLSFAGRGRAMPLHPHVVLVVLLCLPYPAVANGQDRPAPRSRAEYLWQQGQTAVERGALDDAERFYRQSLSADPTLVRNHLSLASLCLGREDLAGACTPLARFLSAQPHPPLIRLRYADVLMRAQQLDEARMQFQRCIADTQDQAGATGAPLIHCHRRLMEIAELQKDSYAEHLHRGVGLYLLARERAALPEAAPTLTTEGLLFKAAAELNLALAERAGEARPCWYLHEIWSRLGQRQPALRFLRAADAARPGTELTPAEQQRLQLAWQCYSWEAADAHR